MALDPEILRQALLGLSAPWDVNELKEAAEELGIERRGDVGVSVRSTNVEIIGPYYPTGELHITFRGGREYVYQGVPPSVFIALLASPSKGQFVNNMVAYSYEYERLS